MLDLSMPDEAFGTDVISLRDFQEEGVRALKSGFTSGDMKQMVCGPTGSGKTELAAGVVSLCYDRGSRVSFLADRLVLVDQASNRFWRYGISHGVIRGDNTRYTDKIIQVCSAQTTEAHDYFDNLDLLIVDRGVQVDTVTLRAPLDAVDDVEGRWTHGVRAGLSDERGGTCIEGPTARRWRRTPE